MQDLRHAAEHVAVALSTYCRLDSLGDGAANEPLCREFCRGSRPTFVSGEEVADAPNVRMTAAERFCCRTL